MTEITVDASSIYDDDPLRIGGMAPENIVPAFESISLIYHGLLVTPPHAYRDPMVQDGLRKRINELTTYSNVSAESILSGIDSIATATYSEENQFIDIVRQVIEKIIEWLSLARDYILKVAKAIFNVRNQNKAAGKTADQNFKSAKNDFEKKQRPFPSKIRCTLPGQAYLLFHTTKHMPKAGWVYNTEGLVRAIETVDRDMTSMMNALDVEIDNVLYSIDVLVDQFKDTNRSDPDQALRRLNSKKQVYGLYLEKFQTIGFGLIQKPVRNPSRFIQHKIGLTNLVSEYGWGSVQSFEVTFETAEFEKIRKLIDDKTDKMLARIYVLDDRFANSRVLKRFNEIRKEHKRTFMENETHSIGVDRDFYLRQQKQVLDRIELIQELVGQLSDTLTLVSRFYARYVITLSNMMGSIAKDISAQPTSEA